MKCHICSSKMESVITDLPFKTDNATIVIMKGLPIFQCACCREYLLDDFVMERVENILDKVDREAELEYAA